MKQLKINTQYNNLICGDCEKWLPFVPDNSVDLIYIDPPFFSNKNYEIIWGNGFELRSFGDRWKGGIEHYIGWMRPKIIEAYRTLKPTGSMLLHCDYRASHHLRFLLDEIFDSKNFINEIIWCYEGGGASKRWFSKKHDNILCYSKTKNYKFNILKEKRSEKSLKRLNNPNGARIDKTKIQDWDKRNILSHWKDIQILNPMSTERIGYKTQKPESLINRFVKAFSNKKDVVLDFMGGGGTTSKAASDLGRRWITGDISPVAYRVIKERLLRNGIKDFIDVNPPLTRGEWRLVKGHTFAKRVCEYMGWEVNPKKSGDGGIDGWANGRKSAVQIKNSDVQVSTVRDMAGVCNGNYNHAVIVGWTFSKGCYEFTAKLARETGIKIELKQADFIVKPITNENKEEYQALYEQRVKTYKQQAQFLKIV